MGYGGGRGYIPLSVALHVARCLADQDWPVLTGV